MISTVNLLSLFVIVSEFLYNNILIFMLILLLFFILIIDFYFLFCLHVNLRYLFIYVSIISIKLSILFNFFILEWIGDDTIMNIIIFLNILVLSFLRKETQYSQMPFICNIIQSVICFCSTNLTRTFQWGYDHGSFNIF